MHQAVEKSEITFLECVCGKSAYTGKNSDAYPCIACSSSQELHPAFELQIIQGIFLMPNSKAKYFVKNGKK